MSECTVRSSAPGKAILLGEHAVVYGEPAIAVPITEVRATAVVESAPPTSGLQVAAVDLGKTLRVVETSNEDPLAVAARLTLDHLSASVPDALVTVTSTIPIASGLGSGAAVSTALVRALARFLGAALEPGEVSELVYEVEKIHHGTPSGIDNTVIAYERPVYFVRAASSGPELMSVGRPFQLVVADTGLPSPTKHVVTQVRQSWRRETARYDLLFRRIGDAVERARHCIEGGDRAGLGALLNENHGLLVELGVSSPPLDCLVKAARSAGAMGAKLSGAGQGGSIVALVPTGSADSVAAALRAVGATRTIQSTVA